MLLNTKKNPCQFNGYGIVDATDCNSRDGLAHLFFMIWLSWAEWCYSDATFEGRLETENQKISWLGAKENFLRWFAHINCVYVVQIKRFTQYMAYVNVNENSYFLHKSWVCRICMMVLFILFLIWFFIRYAVAIWSTNQFRPQNLNLILYCIKAQALSVWFNNCWMQLF